MQSAFQNQILKLQLFQPRARTPAWERCHGRWRRLHRVADGATLM